MKIVKRQKSGVVAMTKRATIYPTFVRNPLLADVHHDIGVVQTYVAVDTRTREIIARDILIALVLQKEELIGYEVGIDPSCEPLINTYQRELLDEVNSNE